MSDLSLDRPVPAEEDPSAVSSSGLSHEDDGRTGPAMADEAAASGTEAAHTAEGATPVADGGADAASDLPDGDPDVAASGHAAPAGAGSEPEPAQGASEGPAVNEMPRPADDAPEPAPEAGTVAAGAAVAEVDSPEQPSDESARAADDSSTDGSTDGAAERPGDGPDDGPPVSVPATEAGEPTAAPEPDPALARINAQLVELTAAIEPVGQLRGSIAELARLRRRDADLIDRLHGDNTRLRAGELAAATAPLLQGLVRLHDQMSSIAAGDAHSVAGMLRTQLLQLLEVAAGVTSYEPNQGDAFDPSRHTGAARVATSDPALDNTVGRRIRPGFSRSDGSVLRVAEVEVLRHTATPSASTDQKESQ